MQLEKCTVTFKNTLDGAFFRVLYMEKPVLIKKPRPDARVSMVIFPGMIIQLFNHF